MDKTFERCGFVRTVKAAKMADFTKKISNLENEIEGYRIDLKNATSPQEKIMYGGLIISSRDALTELLKQQAEVKKGTSS